jgi:3-oxoacyl-[acyl-carrier protein] reductase
MAMALAQAGANVVINARRARAAAGAVADEIRLAGGEAMVAMGDVGAPEQVEDMARAIEERFERIDILVNNAAMRPRRAFLSITFEEWDAVLKTNLYGAIHCTRRFLPAMVRAGHGRIINVSGIGFTRALAKEFGQAGITANTIVPGIFETSRDKEDYPMWPLPQDVIREMVPVGRFGRPEEIGSLCAFLASGASSYINGQAIHCNGGRVMV